MCNGDGRLSLSEVNVVDLHGSFAWYEEVGACVTE